MWGGRTCQEKDSCDRAGAGYSPEQSPHKAPYVPPWEQSTCILRRTSSQWNEPWPSVTGGVLETAGGLAPQRDPEDAWLCRSALPFNVFVLATLRTSEQETPLFGMQSLRSLFRVARQTTQGHGRTNLLWLNQQALN